MPPPSTGTWAPRLGLHVCLPQPRGNEPTEMLPQSPPNSHLVLSGLFPQMHHFRESSKARIFKSI